MAAYGQNPYGNTGSSYGGNVDDRYNNNSGMRSDYRQSNVDRYGGGGRGYDQTQQPSVDRYGGNDRAYNQTQQTGAYAQPSSGPYAQQGRSQQSANPYGEVAQQNTAGRQGGGYGGQQQRPGGAYAGGNEIEMGAMNGLPGGRTFEGPNAIRDECKAIVEAIDTTIRPRLNTLRDYQKSMINSTGGRDEVDMNAKIDRLSSETMTYYRNFAGRIKAIKQQPASGDPRNSMQVGTTDRTLKAAINEYQQVDRDYRRQLQDQAVRQYEIVNPSATEEEIRRVREDSENTQIFTQALMQQNRRGDASSALTAVRSRHDAIQKIERQMIELAQLFQDMEAAVVQQEPAVQNIEDKAEDTVQNLDNGNKQLDSAVVKARSARKKKWICLGICILILLIIAAVIAVVVVVEMNMNKKKT